MDHLLPFALFLSLFLLLIQRFPLVCGLNFSSKQVSSLRLDRIQRHLDTINKPPLLTIQSPDGDIIDCVHKRKQPALDHPLLKNHKIQRGPTEWPKRKKAKENEEDVRDGRAGSGAGGPFQTWRVNGTRCPKGSIPVRRSTVNDVLRAKSIFDYGKKKRPILLDRQIDAPDIVSGNGHESGQSGALW
ncbi:hypothetical protein SDJN02_14929 [Cucurbita argyrosperma subsp. argyrosperma]|nr:hypothetical protein SDJN02_14929 [Cucurbita argyrosperma subsp. argyrosperma]